MRRVSLFALLALIGCTSYSYSELECHVLVVDYGAVNDTLGWDPPFCEELCADGACDR